MKRSTRAFSLGELLVALGLIAVAILSLIALSITIARSNRESIDNTVANTVASQLVERLIDQLREDTPTGYRENFFANDYTTTPYDQGSLTNNNTEYKFKIFAKTINDTSGAAVGGATAKNRLKKIDIEVRWWDSDVQSHQGYGELSVTASRLLGESEL